MERVSGWYKRKVQLIILLIGLVLSAAINADSIGIAQALSTNPALRAGVVAAAEEYAKNAPPKSPSDLQSSVKAATSSLSTYQVSGIPLGWSAFPQTPLDGARDI